MNFITQSRETMLLLSTSSINAVLNDRNFRIPRALSQNFFQEYALYLANSALAAYSFRMLASKNISMLSFIPPTWLRTSALAHSFAERIIKMPGARFLPRAQTACYIPFLFTVLQITLDSLYVYSSQKYEFLRKLRNGCKQIASKLNAFFFVQMALYSFRNVGSLQRGLGGLGILFISFIWGVCAKIDTRSSKTDAFRGLAFSVVTSLILGKYVEKFSWLPETQAHLAIGALSCWNAFKTYTSSVGYYRQCMAPPFPVKKVLINHPRIFHNE